MEIRRIKSKSFSREMKNKSFFVSVKVGPNTSHQETQCFTNHLTTFAGGWIVFPSPINWNYVFSHADLSRNRTIYLTVIVVALLYFLFLIFARWSDAKDLLKVKRRISFIDRRRVFERF